MTRSDPWLTSAMRHTALLAEGDAQLYEAYTDAQRAFLDEARTAVLPTTITAAADPGHRMRDFPDRHRWVELLTERVLPALKRWYDRVFRRATRTDGDPPEYVWDAVETEYLDAFRDDPWADHVHQAAAEEVEDSAAHGDNPTLVRDRLSRLLTLDAPIRSVRDRITRRVRSGRDPDGITVDDADRTHRNQARVRARHASVGAANRATLDAAEQGDEPMYKSWLGTMDERIRDTHFAAHKQSVPLGERFRVGGALLRYPGDPTGPIEEWINCRCALLVLDSEEHEQSNKERNMELPNRTDRHGRALTAAGNGWAETVAAAAAQTTEPDPAVFANPNLSGPTKVTVTDDGRVYGHVACWETSHISFPGRDVKPPRSETNYAIFHRHPVRCADGSRIKTGALVAGTSHADLNMSTSSASAHYDHTGHIVADVRAGEDDHGIWIAGQLHPEITPMQVRILDRYSLSGDWRGGELVAALVVNTPGFPIPEDITASGEICPDTPEPLWEMDRWGDPHALVAAGIVPPQHEPSMTEIVDEVRKLRAELQSVLTRPSERTETTVAHGSSEAERVAREAMARIHGPRFEALAAAAAASTDGRPKRTTNGEAVAQRLRGRKGKSPQGKPPSVKKLAKQDERAKQEREQAYHDVAEREWDHHHAEAESQREHELAVLDRQQQHDASQQQAQREHESIENNAQREHELTAQESQQGHELTAQQQQEQHEDTQQQAEQQHEASENAAQREHEEKTQDAQNGDTSDDGGEDDSDGAQSPPDEGDDSSGTDDEQDDELDQLEDDDRKLADALASLLEDDEDDEDEGGGDMTAAPGGLKDKDSGKSNWVDKVSATGLPNYIDRIAKHLKKKGKSKSHAIAIAINAAKKMCASGDTSLPGRQEVNAGSRSEACAAVSKWEAMKAKAGSD